MSDEIELRHLPELPKYGITRDGRILGPKGIWLKASPGKNGYPTFTSWCPTRRWYVHRVVALAYHGDPPSPDHEVAHLNGIRTDCRAENLQWKTRAGNMADCLRHGTRMLGEDHYVAKLTEKQAVEIHAKYATGGYTMPELAAHYGVNPGTISDIVTGRTWKHVTGGAVPDDGTRRAHKLNAAAVSEIRRAYAAGGVSQPQLARLHNVTQGTICAILQRRTWRHVP